MLSVTKLKTRKGLRGLKLTVESWQNCGASNGSDSKWLFLSSRRPGQHITKLNCPHDRVLAKLGIKFVLYDFRHTFATRMFEVGVDLAT